jgi:hypothetical protein
VRTPEQHIRFTFERLRDFCARHRKGCTCCQANWRYFCRVLEHDDDTLDELRLVRNTCVVDDCPCCRAMAAIIGEALAEYEGILSLQQIREAGL